MKKAEMILKVITIGFFLEFSCVTHLKSRQTNEECGTFLRPRSVQILK